MHHHLVSPTGILHLLLLWFVIQLKNRHLPPHAVRGGQLNHRVGLGLNQIKTCLKTLQPDLIVGSLGLRATTLYNQAHLSPRNRNPAPVRTSALTIFDDHHRVWDHPRMLPHSTATTHLLLRNLLLHRKKESS